MFQLLIGTNIPFMRYRRFAYVLSGAILLATIGWLVMHGGPKYSVDFTGGTLLQIRLGQTLPADHVREALDAGGLKGAKLQQMTGENRNEFLIRLKEHQGQRDLFTRVRDAIHAREPQLAVELRRTEAVGPKVGGELRRKAIWAVLGSLGAILVYVGIRYEFKYAF